MTKPNLTYWSTSSVYLIVFFCVFPLLLLVREPPEVNLTEDPTIDRLMESEFDPDFSHSDGYSLVNKQSAQGPSQAIGANHARVVDDNLTTLEPQNITHKGADQPFLEEAKFFYPWLAVDNYGSPYVGTRVYVLTDSEALLLEEKTSNAYAALLGTEFTIMKELSVRRGAGAVEAEKARILKTSITELSGSKSLSQPRPIDPSYLPSENMMSCCPDNVLVNGSFEDDTPVLNNRFPNGTVTTTDNSRITSDLTYWTYDDGENRGAAMPLIRDPGRAADGDYFLYIPKFNLGRGNSNNYCIGSEILSAVSAGGACPAPNTYLEGLRYVMRYDFVIFNPDNPAGGVGTGVPTVESNSLAGFMEIPVYDENGDRYSVANGQETAVAWDDVATSWQTAYALTTAIPSGGAVFFFSNDFEATTGMLVDDIHLAPLQVDAPNLDNVNCGVNNDEISLTLNPSSNLSGPFPANYAVSAPTGFSISPSLAPYGVETVFTLTRNSGDFSAGDPATIDLEITDEVNTNCLVTATVNNPYPSCGIVPCVQPTALSAFAIQASCTSGAVDANTAYLQISAATDATHYSWSIGSSYDENASVGDNAMTAIGGFPESLIGQGMIDNPTGSQQYTIRVFNGTSDCFTDVTVTLNEQDCEVGCDCEEYIYLNETSSGGKVHKFAVDPSGNLSEILNGADTWYPGSSASELNNPHGLGVDLNGFLYIGESTTGDIRRLTCNGDIFPETAPVMTDAFVINDGAFNIASYQNRLFLNRNSEGIAEYDLCTGAFVGSYILDESPGDTEWGLDVVGSTLYVVGSYIANPNRVYRFDVVNTPIGSTISPILAEGTQTPGTLAVGDDFLPRTQIYGITADVTGNMYLVEHNRTDELSGTVADRSARILKYSPDGELLAMSDWDTVDDESTYPGETDNNNRGFFKAVGIVYSEVADRLYVSTLSPTDDCVSTFDPNTLAYLGAGVPFTSVTSTAKGIAINVECCPTNNNQTISLVQCVTATSEPVFLNDIFPCEGTVCEGQWTPVDDGGFSAGVYEPCDQSIKSGIAAGCYSFTRSSDGSSPTSRCGAFVQTLNLEIVEVEDISITIDEANAPECGTTLVATTTASNIKWQSSTTGPLADDFADIPGGTNSTLTIDALVETTYFRTVVVSGNSAGAGTCSGGNCVFPSNVISLAPVDCSTEHFVTITSSELSSCVGGNFEMMASLDWQGAPTTGNFEYSVDGGPYLELNRSNLSANAAGEMVTFPDLVCEQTKMVRIRFEDSPDCFAEMRFVFPPTDPAGYIYCDDTGEIITGGTISVTPPPGGSIQILTESGVLQDGTTGRYAWAITGSPVVAGRYQMSYTPPGSQVLTGTPGGFGDGDAVLDPTAGVGDNLGSDDPLLLGSDVNGAGDMLLDFSAASNPYFLEFDLEQDDPFIDLNNLPLEGCCPEIPINITAAASCEDEAGEQVEANTYYIEVSMVSGGNDGPYDVTIAGETQSFTGTSLFFGPFNHSGVGGAVQVVTATDNGTGGGCELTDSYQVPEVLCGINDGGQASGCFCAGPTTDPLVPTSYILVQSRPGSFQAGGSTGQIQTYILVDDEGFIVDVNLTGLFETPIAGTYTAYAINYLADEDPTVSNFLLPGESVQPILDGFNSTGPLADNCYTVCDVEDPVTYTTCTCYSVGSTVFTDLDNDGAYEQVDGEMGIGGVDIQLLDGTEIIATTTTDANGDYYFGGLPAGMYSLNIPMTPAVYPTSSTPTDTADNGEDNDDNGIQATSGDPVMSPIFELGGITPEPSGVAESGSGATQDDDADVFGDMTQDFGFFAPVTVGDTTFVDLDMDGTQSPGDLPLEDVAVTIYDVATGLPVTLDADGVAYVSTQTTDDEGSYLFENLPPGSYYIEFDISGIEDAEFYDFTTANVEEDTDDSDATPVMPGDDVASSDTTPQLRSGDSDLTLDAGIVCAVSVTVAEPSTICSTQVIDLTVGASVTPVSLVANWSTPDGTGTFDGGTLFSSATTYTPSEADLSRGTVTLVLSTDDPSGLCTAASESVTIEILKVGCGTFFWDGR